ncbi:MAG: helicase-related protein [Bryobacterales bacterium]|nr:helicase-related protein [Bryobacterales bacterium]MDE0296600.1 helicase-related protein [Bryobacterales bacterium]
MPTGAPDEQRTQDAEEELDEPAEPIQGGDDSTTPDRGSGKRVFLPSSMGLSILVDEETTSLEVTVSWGDYVPGDKGTTHRAQSEGPQGSGSVDNDSFRLRFLPWVRRPRSEAISINLSSVKIGTPVSFDVPGSDGLKVVSLLRPTRIKTAAGIRNVRAVSVFIVNRRPPAKDNELQDTAFAFQLAMSVEVDRPLVPRFDPSGFDSEDWDERLADLHYRDVADYSVGHNVSTRDDVIDSGCLRVHTEWMPRASVERVEPSSIADVEFGMEALGALSDAHAAKDLLEPLVRQYRDWIVGQRVSAGGLGGRRREVADELTVRAVRTADRIQTGIDLLAEPDVLEAFRIANRAMAAAARRRRAQEESRKPEAVSPPAWRPFQLAYILMNLRGIAEPTHVEREMVDLLFFPTGGGKTEAYLGLAAFTLVLRRLREPDPTYRGLSVLMRYTLRLLTLDQLGRAAALVCALELEREAASRKLGEWPFEIALWVGRAATPNYMGRKGDRSNDTARAKTLRFARDTSRDPPLPLDQCPWCGTKFNRHSFRLHPNSNEPTDLLVRCANRHCQFSGRKRHLPIVAVDEPIYRRLPAFMIATADKFAALPWSGETARFFRGGDPEDARPPDLIIQDELHLISGPLGTMAGLYETAIDHLCRRRIGDRDVRPKVVASTATVRLAQKQIRALFDRPLVEVFPPPGIDRRDSFFARQAPEEEVDARLYLGLAAQGRGPKVVFLRSMITLMAAAQAAWNAASKGTSPNPADPYMTAVTYFNALRELGSARRIVEDEIGSRLLTYAGRKRLDESSGLFADRRIAFEPVELTSRVGTANVADAKRCLALGFHEDEHVDVALATNMISVGLDITRLGLMVVAGQPKMTAEYIQATSRVGRDASRPGLVVTLLNVHKPRDRSHYERFATYHDSFYRGVEATSVTPFSARAMDRGLSAVTVALARLGISELTPMLAAKNIEDHGDKTKELAESVGARAQGHVKGLPADFGDNVKDRVRSLIDDWATLSHEAQRGGVTFGYSLGRESKVSAPLLREMIDPNRDTLTDTQLLFRAPRSLRDVEPSVLLGIKTPEGQDLA